MILGFFHGEIVPFFCGRVFLLGLGFLLFFLFLLNCIRVLVILFYLPPFPLLVFFAVLLFLQL